jgi:hypothetical protein
MMPLWFWEDDLPCKGLTTCSGEEGYWTEFLIWFDPPGTVARELELAER